MPVPAPPPPGHPLHVVTLRVEMFAVLTPRVDVFVVPVADVKVRRFCKVVVPVINNVVPEAVDQFTVPTPKVDVAVVPVAEAKESPGPRKEFVPVQLVEEPAATKFVELLNEITFAPDQRTGAVAVIDAFVRKIRLLFAKVNVPVLDITKSCPTLKVLDCTPPNCVEVR